MLVWHARSRQNSFQAHHVHAASGGCVRKVTGTAFQQLPRSSLCAMRCMSGTLAVA